MDKSILTSFSLGLVLGFSISYMYYNKINYYPKYTNFFINPVGLKTYSFTLKKDYNSDTIKSWLDNTISICKNDRKFSLFDNQITTFINYLDFENSKDFVNFRQTYSYLDNSFNFLANYDGYYTNQYINSKGNLTISISNSKKTYFTNNIIEIFEFF